MCCVATAHDFFAGSTHLTMQAEEWGPCCPPDVLQEFLAAVAASETIVEEALFRRATFAAQRGLLPLVTATSVLDLAAHLVQISIDKCLASDDADTFTLHVTGDLGDRDATDALQAAWATTVPEAVAAVMACVRAAVQACVRRAVTHCLPTEQGMLHASPEVVRMLYGTFEFGIDRVPSWAVGAAMHALPWCPADDSVVDALGVDAHVRAQGLVRVVLYAMSLMRSDPDLVFPDTAACAGTLAGAMIAHALGDAQPYWRAVPTPEYLVARRSDAVARVLAPVVHVPRSVMTDILDAMPALMPRVGTGATDLAVTAQNVQCAMRNGALVVPLRPAPRGIPRRTQRWLKVRELFTKMVVAAYSDGDDALRALAAALCVDDDAAVTTAAHAILGSAHHLPSSRPGREWCWWQVDVQGAVAEAVQNQPSRARVVGTVALPAGGDGAPRPDASVLLAALMTAKQRSVAMPSNTVLVAFATVWRRERQRRARQREEEKEGDSGACIACGGGGGGGRVDVPLCAAHPMCGSCDAAFVESRVARYILGDGLPLQTTCCWPECKTTVFPRAIQLLPSELAAVARAAHKRVGGTPCCACGTAHTDDVCGVCGAQTCRRCGMESHPGRVCLGAANATRPHALLAAAKIQGCPNCRVPTAKDAHCNHMTCPACGVHWCWACLAVLDLNQVTEHYRSRVQCVEYSVQSEQNRMAAALERLAAGEHPDVARRAAELLQGEYAQAQSDL